MRVLEAKDFLVQQTAEQAALENVPLSKLEKRMMYFTEVDECPEDPIALNEAFEAKYDTDEYEAKVSKLMHHAYRRIKKDNPEGFRRWKEAMKELSKGDHYMLVLCGDGAPVGPVTVFVKFPVLPTIGITLLAVLVAVSLGVHYDSSSGGGRGRYVAPSGAHTSMPLPLQHLLWFLMVAGYLYYVILPWILKKPLPGLGSLFSKLFRRESKGSPDR